MPFTTLIDPQALADHIADPSFVIVDCRFSLDDVDWGEREYRTAHIPGAVYTHLDRDLSGPKTGINGRHPLPDSGVLALTLGRLGIKQGMQVVAYDQDAGSYASRLWWLARWMGHAAVAVLDGGFAAWTAGRRPTVSGTEQRPAAAFAGSPDPTMVADVHAVERLTRGITPGLLLDARAPERFRGDVEPIDRVAGHIPGAVNHPYKENLGADGRFLPPDVLRSHLSVDLQGRSPREVVAYCGSGVTACHNLLALEHAGMPGAQLYPGSWSEWSSDPLRPIERGDRI